MSKCKKCNRWFKNKRANNTHYSRMHGNIQSQEEINTSFDFNEIKVFITSEIKKALKELNFSKSDIINDDDNVGIISIKPAKKMPKFNSFETNKHLVVKELKEQLSKGIENVLKEVGSFDNQINFLEHVEILV